MGNEVRRETGGSVSVTHYGQKHAVVTESRGMEIYNVYLDLRRHPLPVLPENLRSTLATILPIHPHFQHRLNRRVWIRYDRSQELAASLARIAGEMRSSRPGALEIIQHSFQIFLIDICRAALRHGFVRSASQPVPSWVERIRQEIDRNFATPHDLRTLAKRARVSVPYLCRFFKSYTGKTVIEYLVERRIQAAVWKLRETDEKIISIALTCGFNDIAYFNRVFKRIMSTTPSQYRNTLKK
jgi:AraC-like DNA-binding protein